MIKEKIAKNKVMVENGKIKTILTEETQRNGMTVEEFRRLGHEKINKVYELLRQNGSIN